MIRFATLATAALLLAAPALVAQIHVPGDFDDLQEAIDAAQYGDVIVVTGGDYGPFVIDKPLTLVGSASDRPVLRTYSTMEFQSQPEPSFDGPVTLAGPGAGTVTIAGFDIGGDELFWEYQQAPPAIRGGGFDALHVLHCDVAAPAWTNYGNPNAAPGIEVDLPYLLVRDSRVVGGKAGWNGGFDSNTLMPGDAGIESTGDVELFDAHVIGGEGYDNTYDNYFLPTECSQVNDGKGGTGVVTPGTLRAARSVIEGGPGAEVKVDDGPGVGAFLCQKEDGEVMEVGAYVELDDSLQGSGALVPNSTWTLRSDSASTSSALLLVSVEPVAPQATFAGALYMPPTELWTVPIATGGAVLTVPVRDDPGLLGATVVIQRYDLSEGTLSRPVHATFLGE